MLQHRRSILVSAFIALAMMSGTAAYADIVGLQVTGNRATASVEFPAGPSLDLELVFEDSIGLSAESLGLSAQLVDPLDPTLLARLRRIGGGIPLGLPILIAIEPPADQPLTFRGVVEVHIHTHDLPFSVNTPLRLVAASNGGTFHDITDMVSLGSFRTKGTKGGFSEFLIAVELDSRRAVIQKFNSLEAYLGAHASQISDPQVVTDLNARLNAAKSAFMSGDLITAVDEAQAFSTLVHAQAPSVIPDVWRSNGGVENVAGNLRQRANTLRFSLSFRSHVLP